MNNWQGLHIPGLPWLYSIVTNVLLRKPSLLLSKWTTDGSLRVTQILRLTTSQPGNQSMEASGEKHHTFVNFKLVCTPGRHTLPLQTLCYAMPMLCLCYVNHGRFLWVDRIRKWYHSHTKPLPLNESEGGWVRLVSTLKHTTGFTNPMLCYAMLCLCYAYAM